MKHVNLVVVIQMVFNSVFFSAETILMVFQNALYDAATTGRLPNDKLCGQHDGFPNRCFIFC